MFYDMEWNMVSPPQSFTGINNCTLPMAGTITVSFKAGTLVLRGRFYWPWVRWSSPLRARRTGSDSPQSLIFLP